MKEIVASLWLGINSLLGINTEEEVKPKEVQVGHQEVSAAEKNDSPSQNESHMASEETQEKKQTTSDGKRNYNVPKDAPWWSPAQGTETISETTQNGQEGQVSTIWGNGSQGQTETTMDHPRDLQLDSKGNIYFVDGSQQEAKLRMFDGKKNKTVVDLVNNKVIRREGYFASAGMAIIHDIVYISSTYDVYKVVDGRVTQLTPKIKQYMENKRLQNIYRTEKHGDYLYFMFYGKSNQYHIARYNIKGGAVEEIIPTKPMPNPYNFYVHGDNEIYISTTTGYVIEEKLFPRETITAWETGDPQTEIADVWIGENDSMYYVQWEDQSKAVVYENPIGISADDVQVVAGARRGFTDGIKDEVEMDEPIDFVWDGSGYIFGDMGNHSIRKLWTKVGPMNK